MHPQHQKSNRRVAGPLLAIGLVVVLGLGWIFRQDISDWFRLRQYSPPPEVVTLAEQTTMTDEGRKVFYTTHPQVTDEQEFNSNCRQGHASEYSIVLGCYISNGGLYGDIYLYNIDDQRLNGVKQVTAAHEMLHAAYDRLKGDEKTRIDELLQQTFDNLPDGRIKLAVAQYQSNDPAAVPNELHSILGTELRDLPPELNEYYQQYFSNRLAVVGFSEQYDAEFARRQEQVANYDRQLEQLKATIDANKEELESQRQVLERQQAQLDNTNDPGDFNAQVAEYNQNVAQFNALVAETRSLIEEYNRLVEERNSIALEVEELTEAIDSRPETL